MGREDKTHQSLDEEYMPEFTGEPTGENYGAEQSTTPRFSPEELESMKPGLHPAVRKIGVVIGLMVAIIVVMWFLRHQEKERLAAQMTGGAQQVSGTAVIPDQAAGNKPAAVPVAAVNLPAAPAAPAPAAPAKAEMPNNPALNATNVQAMQSMDQETTSKINELTTQMHNLADAMSRISQTVQTLETKVAGMAQAHEQEHASAPTPVEKMQASVPKQISRHGHRPDRHVARNAERERMATPVQTMAVENPVEIPYVVRGIIPRRAWVDGPYGANLSVTVGDVIPGVGKVLKINAPAGEVITTGGTIEYGE